MQNVGKKREKKKTNEERVFKSKWVIDGPSNESEREREWVERKKKEEGKKEAPRVFKKKKWKTLATLLLPLSTTFREMLGKILSFCDEGVMLRGGVPDLLENKRGTAITEKKIWPLIKPRPPASLRLTYIYRYIYIYYNIFAFFPIHSHVFLISIPYSAFEIQI